MGVVHSPPYVIKPIYFDCTVARYPLYYIFIVVADCILSNALDWPVLVEDSNYHIKPYDLLLHFIRHLITTLGLNYFLKITEYIFD